eukprot:7391812-Prymnesium_polylepis.1
MRYSIENISDCEYRLFGHPQHQSLAVSPLGPAQTTQQPSGAPIHTCTNDRSHLLFVTRVRRPLRHSHSLIERSVFIRRVCVRDRQSCLSLWLLGLAFLLLGRRLRCGRRRALALALRHRLLLLAGCGRHSTWRWGGLVGAARGLARGLRTRPGAARTRRLWRRRRRRRLRGFDWLRLLLRRRPLAKLRLLQHRLDHALLEDVGLGLPRRLLGREALPLDEKLAPSALRAAPLEQLLHLEHVLVLLQQLVDVDLLLLLLTLALVAVLVAARVAAAARVALRRFRGALAPLRRPRRPLPTAARALLPAKAQRLQPRHLHRLRRRLLPSLRSLGHLRRHLRLEQRAELLIVARAADGEAVEKVPERELQLHLLGSEQLDRPNAAHLAPLRSHLGERREHPRLLLLGDAKLLLRGAQRRQPLAVQLRRLLMLRLHTTAPLAHRLAQHLTPLRLAPAVDLQPTSALPHVEGPLDHRLARPDAEPRAEHTGEVAVERQRALRCEVVDRVALELAPRLRRELRLHLMIVQCAAREVLLRVAHRPHARMLEPGLEHLQEVGVAPRRRVQRVDQQRLVQQRPIPVLQRVHLTLEQRRWVGDQRVEELEDPRHVVVELEHVVDVVGGEVERVEQVVAHHRLHTQRVKHVVVLVALQDGRLQPVVRLVARLAHTPHLHQRAQSLLRLRELRLERDHRHRVGVRDEEALAHDHLQLRVRTGLRVLAQLDNL